VDDLTEFRERVKEEEKYKLTYRKKINLNTIDYEAVGSYINFRKKYKKSKDLTFRREGNGVCIYSNDLNIVNEVLAFGPNSEVTQVVPMPAGVIQFKKEPPAAYRIFLKTLTKPGHIRQELIDYLERTPDMVPNSTLERALGQRWPNVYFHEGHYFNYNDDRNILMMHLMFPGILGKSYKLEKK
jgi:hypothetical protein